mmetsp:Transcript_7153/g.15492  ORF Transcript_7153/g.15492 Transcript_7153/m.15492 type:complete len:269 (-) Transcript_7153:103-909(-)
MQLLFKQTMILIYKVPSCANVSLGNGHDRTNQGSGSSSGGRGSSTTSIFRCLLLVSVVPVGMVPVGMIPVVVTILLPLAVVMSIMIIRAFELLVLSSDDITENGCARDFHIMNSILTSLTQRIVCAIIVDHAQRQKVGLTLIARAIALAPGLSHGSVGIIPAIISTNRRGTIRGTRSECTRDRTRRTALVVIVESILDGLGNVGFGTVIVMGLDDEVVLLALGGHAVRGASVGFEVVEGVEHGALGGTVDGVAEFFGFAGAYVDVDLG